jgi:hypothetical protein
MDLKDSYYMEVFEGSKLFEKLSTSIDGVRDASRPIVEWNVYGELHGEDGFFVKGLTSRKYRKRRPELAKGELVCPVVLVMLHTRNLGGGVVLQRRSKYNAQGGLRKLSNISGCMTDEDLVSARSGAEPDAREGVRSDHTLREYVLARDGVEGLSASEPKPVLGELDRILPDIGKTLIDPKHDAWYQAALRELSEELDFEIKPDELENPKLKDGPGGEQEVLTLCLRKKDRVMLFRLFTLELTTAKVQKLQQVKYAGIERFTRAELERLHQENPGGFNALLSNNFRTFSRIWEGLGIE